MAHISRRRFAALSLAALSGAVSTTPALSQSSYPSRPINFIVGFPPGGVADSVARIIGPALSKRLGQPVVLDNRAGAGGVIGAAAIARAAPDGYTLGFGVSGALTSAVSLVPKLSYDPLHDFAYLSKAVDNPLALVVSSSLGVSSLSEFISLAKSKPGKLMYGSPGAGTAMHLAAEKLNQMAGIDMRHVPYKGSAPVVTDLLGDHVSIAVLELAAIQAQLATGRIKALAVTSAKRSAVAPDLPTMAEAGVPGYKMDSWLGVVMPAKTPPEIAKRVTDELHAVLNDPQVRALILNVKS